MSAESLILEEIGLLKEMIAGADSPRFSQKKAKRFLQLGDDKFKRLVKSGRVRVYKDDFGDLYYMKNDLMEYLESNIVRGKE
ncbi:MAG: hypothetical protein RBS48_04935 [Ignavibacteriaceae bacterium]|jgi:hypothetical protein|nr:hypothetical protein [Ignavibacteriaceae bacterium]